MADRPSQAPGQRARHAPADGAGEPELALLLALLWRRKATILLVAILGTLAVGAVVMRLEPTYRAAAVLLFDETRPAPAPAAEDPPVGRAPDLASKIEVMLSHSLLSDVVRRAGLLFVPEFNPALRPDRGVLHRVGLDLGAAQVAVPGFRRQRANTIASLRERLQVRPLGRSRALEIGVAAGDPAIAARVANTLAAVYLERAEAKARAERSETTAWLDARVADMRRRVQRAEARLADYRISSGLAERGRQARSLEANLKTLSQALVEARTEHARVQARLLSLQRLRRESRADAQGSGEEGADTPGPIGLDTAGMDKILDSKELTDLRGQAAELARERAELAASHGFRHPRMLEATAKLADLRTRIQRTTDQAVKAVRMEAALTRRRVAALARELEHAQAETGDIGLAEVRLAQLEREAAAERAVFNSFLERLKTTRLSADAPGAPADLITPAEPPIRPDGPNRPLLAGFGLLAAFALGLALAVLAEALDRGARGLPQLERQTGRRGLALVPDSGRRRPLARAVVEKPLGAAAEAVRGLLTALLLSDLDRPPRTVMLTSARTGEGKTALACALARTAARGGRRVLLVDADLRRPGVTQALEMAEGSGLAELLAGTADASAAIRRDGASPHGAGLHVLAAGRAQHPGTLLESERFAALLGELGQGYDLVVIDAPPVLAVADARALARRVDATVLAVRWARTPMASVQHALKQLDDAGAEVAGLALTRVDLRRHALYGQGDGAGWRRRRGGYAD